jgi:hypothetical protein
LFDGAKKSKNVIVLKGETRKLFGDGQYLTIIISCQPYFLAPTPLGDKGQAPLTPDFSIQGGYKV